MECLKRALFAALLFTAADPALAQAPEGMPLAPSGRGQEPRALSPSVLPDHRVTFRQLAPEANEVVVTNLRRWFA
jgi:hypothetical protein